MLGRVALWLSLGISIALILSHLLIEATGFTAFFRGPHAGVIVRFATSVCTSVTILLWALGLRLSSAFYSFWFLLASPFLMMAGWGLFWSVLGFFVYSPRNVLAAAAVLIVALTLSAVIATAVFLPWLLVPWLSTPPRPYAYRRRERPAA